MKQVIFTFLIFAAGFTLIQCTTEPDFSNVPSISDATISKTTLTDRLGNAADSLVISIKFQDGDGDLGSSTDEVRNDTLTYPPPYYNYFVRVFRQKNGQFSEVIRQETDSGIFPRLRQDGKSGPLEGQIRRGIVVQHRTVPPNDTLKYYVKIRDRAGNMSNEIETPAVIVHVRN